MLYRVLNIPLKITPSSSKQCLEAKEENKNQSDTVQKQRIRGVLRKSCSENMQQIYRRTLLQICCIVSEHLFIRMPMDGCFRMLQLAFRSVRRRRI